MRIYEFFIHVNKRLIHIRIHIIHIVKFRRINTLSGTAVVVLPKYGAERSISQCHHFISNAGL